MHDRNQILDFEKKIQLIAAYGLENRHLEFMVFECNNETGVFQPELILAISFKHIAQYNNMGSCISTVDACVV